MSHILIDTSCWIEYFGREGDSDVRAAVQAAVGGNHAAICGMIAAEFLAYVRPDVRVLIDESFAGLRWMSIGRSTYDRAVGLGRSLRDGGLTVPASDLVIAATAMEHDATLLHVDRNFDRIAEVETDLTVHNARGKAVSPPRP